MNGGRGGGGGGGSGGSITREISGSASTILAVKAAAGVGAGLIVEAKVQDMSKVCVYGCVCACVYACIMCLHVTRAYA